MTAGLQLYPWPFLLLLFLRRFVVLILCILSALLLQGRIQGVGPGPPIFGKVNFVFYIVYNV